MAGDTMDEAKPSSEDPVDIPKFDLAENILAGQRRISARRRKGPGRSGQEEADLADVGRKTGLAAWPEDVQALRQVVADIVARDIEQLRKGTSGHR